MAKYQNFEKYNMMECFIECHKNTSEACDLYFQRYPEREQPDPRIFNRLERNLMTYGTFAKDKPKTYNSANKENNTINVLASVYADPTTSCRCIEDGVGVARSTTSRILRENKFRCYRARKTQLLYPGDADRRMTFCQWYLGNLNGNEEFSRQIIWTDEARIASNGIFNRYNNHIWATENPHEQINRVHQGRFGFNVWVALLGNGVLAYEIYENNLNWEAYLNILERQIISYMDTIPLYNRQKLYFQQDGAPPHNAANVVDCLNTNFGEQWLGNNGPIRWPARSPDLTPLDFFLWGFLGNKIYRHRSDNIGQLREKFEVALRSVSNIHIRNALNGVRKRCQWCINQNGHQFEHLL